MKKMILSLGIVALCASAAIAQEKKVPTATLTTGSAEGTPSTTLKPENLAFKMDTHDFGTVPEGPAAEYEFKFKNTGKEPITISKVQASCGCTTPSYSKDPVLPGKEGAIKASYNTNGRPGAFTKTITVVSNAGTKVVTIKGTVEKAPASSVPENNSMIKTN